MKRKLVDTLDRRKEQMIASLWANSNYDDDKGTRKNAIEEIEASYDEAVAKIWGDPADEEIETEDTYGFFAAGERGLNKIAPPELNAGSVGDAVGAIPAEIDQF